MENDVCDYVKTCKIYQWMHVKRHLLYGLLRSLPVLTELWTHLAVDFITDLPPSKGRRGIIYNTILVIMDRFSKYALYIVILKKATIEDLANIFLN